MKTIKFFAVALAALTMFSCSKENVDNPGNNAPGEHANLTIKVTGEANVKPSSKAIGAATTTDVTVNNYIVFLFRDGGALDCPPQYSAAADDLKITVGTTAAKKAYVVANTGVLAGGLFAGVSSEAGLKAIVGDLMSSANTSSQTNTNLWMSGSGNVTFGTGENANKGVATAVMSFVGAKIELVVIDERINMTGPDIKIQDKEVVLLFAGKAGKFFETVANQAIQTDFYSGDVSYPDPTVSTASTALSDAVVTPFTANAAKDVFNHFYTFGNNGAKMQTILAIKSTKTVSGVDGTIYYPIHFTLADAGMTIEPGSSYTVNVTLKGDVNAGGGGGTTDPEEPVIDAEIAVTVTAAKWLAKTVNKTFN